MDKKKITKEILDLLKTLLFSFLIFLILTNFFIIPVRVEGSSMFPTLQDGERGFSSVFNIKNREIERFQIVTVTIDDKMLVKRVIGLPNDLVEVKDEQLYINGEALKQSFLNQEYFEEIMRSQGYFTNDLKIQLGENEYFLMGDNRVNSRDSRYYGPFDRDSISSVGVFVFWPLSKFGSK